MSFGAGWLRRIREVGSLALWLTLVLGEADTATAGQRSRRGRDADFGLSQVKTINEQLRKRWSEDKIAPSVKAPDGQWCRRVYLDVLGRIPSVSELREFTSSRAADKKTTLVNQLLHDEKYTEEYARNWTTIWTNILIGRTGGSERNSLTNREGLQKYLRDSLARNKPYHELAFELVTATGSNTPGENDFNGAVNFLAMKVNDENATLATAATSKILLGLQVQCTQCHNHPFNEWKQQKFWEFNAFFRQTSSKRQFVPGTREVASANLVNEDFAGEDTVPRPERAAIYYELRNGLLKVAYPVFVDGTEIGRSGFVQDVDRRIELGKLILRSEYLDKMIVNRYWAHFLGYGFTKPIDDLGPHNPPSHPQLLDYLGHEVRKNSYDLKQLIRWITLSEAYSLSSKRNKSNEIDDPQLGESPRFSHFYLRQMRAEELYESLLVATRAGETGGTYEEQERKKRQWLTQFVTAFGTDEGGESTTFNGTIPQALMMFNGELIRNATRAGRGSFLWDIAGGNFKPEEKIEYLFLAGLARRPTREEVDIANKLLQARAHDQLNAGPQRYGKQHRRPTVNPGIASLAALQDVWWAILNSNEFILNH